MKVNRPILVALTILVSLLMSLALLNSWAKPQVQSQLNLYQSDLQLQASEWEGLNSPIQGEGSLQKSVLGESPIKDAAKSYETVRDSAQKNLDKLKKEDIQLSKQSTSPNQSITPRSAQEQQEIETALSNLQFRQKSQGKLIDSLNLRLGLLYARAGESDKALQTWTDLTSSPKASISTQKIVPTAQVLLGIWSDPPRLLPNADAVLNQNLKGWFRFQALSKLYSLQQRPDAAQELVTAEQAIAQSAFLRLSIVALQTVLGSIIGIAILLTWGIRSFFKAQGNRKSVEAASPSVGLLKETGLTGEIAPFSPSASGNGSLIQPTLGAVLWPTETIWQVMVLWFAAFLGVSIVMPLGFQLLGLDPATFRGRSQAYYALFNYGFLMLVGIGILQISLKPYTPNALKWLRLKWKSNWIGWGLGGYFVALPLVLIVSVLNQKLLKEQGGSNPILEIILQGHDPFSIAVLWFLVAVCAPLFEETLFRGFFLTSLTRYMTEWQAIALSGFIFALAHLNLGDVLPLTLLGMVLGTVYWRSRNLLSSMLLHSVWNSGSFIGLLILGSSGS
jgi:uncharacterized protein